jgi:hypothetical protein
MRLYEKFAVFRVTFDFRTLLCLCQYEKQIQFDQILNSLLILLETTSERITPDYTQILTFFQSFLWNILQISL